MRTQILSVLSLGFASPMAAQTTYTGGVQTASHPFGATFPLQGVQPVAASPGDPWVGNVYLGTNMQFNEGAYFSYTNQYYVPEHGPVQGATDPAATTATTAPTAAPDYTGQTCFGYLTPCPSGYYCAVAAGYTPTQQGSCYKAAASSGGLGWWGNQMGAAPTPHPTIKSSSTWFSKLGSCGGSSECGFKAVNGDCWCDSQCGTTGDCCEDVQKNCDFAAATWGSQIGATADSTPVKAINQFGSSSTWFSKLDASCAGASVCGFQAVNGDCWCDSKCEQTGDCCADVKDHCSFAAAQTTPTPVSPLGAAMLACGEDRLKGDCTGKCGSTQPVLHGGASQHKCFCDGTCAAYGDCCCSYTTMCLGGGR